MRSRPAYLPRNQINECSPTLSQMGQRMTACVQPGGALCERDMGAPRAGASGVPGIL